MRAPSLEEEARAAATIQACHRGRKARREFTYRQSSALGWVHTAQHIKAHDDGSSSGGKDVGGLDVDYIQSEAIMQLEKTIRKLTKRQGGFAEQLAGLAILPGLVEERLAAAEALRGVRVLLVEDPIPLTLQQLQDGEGWR